MRKLLKLFVIALIIQAICGVLAVSASTALKTKSSDISGHWAEVTINKWLEQGYINGYSDGSFKPNKSITRAEFVKIVNNVFKVERYYTELDYADLPSSHWAYKEFSAAIHAGYIGGTSPTTLSPDQVIARQEAAVMLVKLTGLEGTAALEFMDADQIPQWSKKAIEALVAGGFMKGDTKGNFRARDGLTRAEAVVLIDKVHAQLGEVFNENPDLNEQLDQQKPIHLTNAFASDFVWTKKYTDDIKAPVIGFDPNHGSYLAVLEEAYIGETIHLIFFAADHLELAVSIDEANPENTGENKNILHLLDEAAREDIQLKVEENKDYHIYVNVIDSGSGQHQEYYFEVRAYRDYSDSFKLNKTNLVARNLKAGDQLEITLPAAHNSTNTDYTMKYTVSSSKAEAFGSYVGDYYLPLTDYYVQDRTLSFNPSNEAGKIHIKLIREGILLYDGEYSYDFTQE